MAAKMNAWQRHQKLRAVLFRDGPCCWICTAEFTPKNPPTLDHVIPRSKGGSNAVENLRAAHRICNNRRGDTTRGEDWSRAHGGRSIEEVGLG